ncbi:MAG: hypothetical protein ACLU9S_06895 [Oscillospiraceae bacterium]
MRHIFHSRSGRTGEGHNSAAKAIAEVLTARGIYSELTGELGLFDAPEFSKFHQQLPALSGFTVAGAPAVSRWLPHEQKITILRQRMPLWYIRPSPAWGEAVCASPLETGHHDAVVLSPMFLPVW